MHQNSRMARGWESKSVESQQHEVPGRSARYRESADEIEVRSTFPMNLKDYQIRGLSKFLGVLKMDPAIAVHVDLVFAPAAAPAGHGRATASYKPIAARRRY